MTHLFVKVYVHVIYAKESRDGGYIPDDHIGSQIDVLNQDFAETKLKFKLEETTVRLLE